MNQQTQIAKQEEQKVYYSYTPQDFKIIYIADTRKVAKGGMDTLEKKIEYYGERATIACTLSEDGKSIYWGISLCDEEDLFNKEYGRVLAKERMDNHFGVISLDNYKNKDNKNQEEIILNILNSLTKSVYTSFGKYNEKIKRFNSILNLKKAAIKYENVAAEIK